MSSADDEVTCPNRKCQYEEATATFNSNGYTQVFCPRCGHNEETDDSTGETKSAGGFGGYRVTYWNGVASLGHLVKPLTPQRLKRSFRHELRSLDVAHLEFYLPMNGEWKTVVLKDKPRSRPKTFRRTAPPAATVANRPKMPAMADLLSPDLPF